MAILENLMVASCRDKKVNLEKSLYGIYSHYNNDVKMIKEFLENIDKLLTRRQKKKRKSDFSVEDRDQLKKLLDYLRTIKEDNTTKSKSSKKSLTITSKKLEKIMFGIIIPMKQKKILAEMALTYLISYQETFIKEYIKEILISRRDLLKTNKKTLTFEEICDFDSMEPLILHMVQEDVDKTFYGGIDDIADYLNKRFGLSMQSEFKDWEIIREASFRRNLIIHNKGITNKIYCLKTGHKETNSHLSTDMDYVLNATNAVFSFFDFIHTRMHEKLGLPQPKLRKITRSKNNT